MKNQLKKALVVLAGLAVLTASYVYWWENVRIVSVDRLNAIGSVQEIRALVMKHYEIDKKHGLNLTFTSRNPGDLERSIIAREHEGIHGTSPFFVPRSIAEGHRLKIYSPEIAMTYYLAVRTESSYQTIENLRGRKVAVLPKVTAAYSSIALILQSSLGINPEKDFRLVFGSIPEAIELLRRGEVDAAIVSYPLAASIFASGQFRSVARLADFWEEKEGLSHPFVVNIAFEDWLENRMNRKVLKRYIAASNETVQLMMDRPEVVTEENNPALNEYLKTNGLDSPEAKRLLRENVPALLYSAWSEKDAEAIKLVLKRAKEYGFLPPEAQIDAVMNPLDFNPR